MRLAGLVDTGCTNTLFSDVMAVQLGIRKPSMQALALLDGSSTGAVREGVLGIKVGDRSVELRCYSVESLVLGFDVILGLDFIKAMGGVVVNGNSVQFGADLSGCAGGRESCGVIGGCAASGVASGMARDEGAGESGETSSGGEIGVGDADFEASFTGGRWVIRWKWKDGPPQRLSWCSGYNAGRSVTGLRWSWIITHGGW